MSEKQKWTKYKEDQEIKNKQFVFEIDIYITEKITELLNVTMYDGTSHPIYINSLIQTTDNQGYLWGLADTRRVSCLIPQDKVETLFSLIKEEIERIKYAEGRNSIRTELNKLLKQEHERYSPYSSYEGFRYGIS